MRPGLLTAVCLLVALPVCAQTGAEEVYVYTNADLEALTPIPTQDGTPPTDEEIAQSWRFVQTVIDDANERVDAQRDYELSRLKTEAEAGALDRVGSTPRYGLPYNYRFGLYEGGYGYEHRKGDRIRKQVSRLWDPPNAHLFRPITPIHARPYPTNIFRARGAFERAGGGGKR